MIESGSNTTGRRSTAMNESRRSHRRIALVPWGICVAGLSLLAPSAAYAQADPVEKYQAALEENLDRLMGPGREQSLIARKQELTRLAEQIDSAGQLSRAIRSPESTRLREARRLDKDLMDN